MATPNHTLLHPLLIPAPASLGSPNTNLPPLPNHGGHGHVPVSSSLPVMAVYEKRRRMKLSLLMQQLDFLFYALCALGYTLDGKTLLLILRTVSQVQFCQPNQIQPNRSLRFFTLASLLIFACALISHLTLLRSPSSIHDPGHPQRSGVQSGIFIDFIGQAPIRNHFTDAYSIPLSPEFILDECEASHSSQLFHISFTRSISLLLSNQHPHHQHNLNTTYTTTTTNPVVASAASAAAAGGGGGDGGGNEDLTPSPPSRSHQLLHIHPTSFSSRVFNQ